MCDIINKWYEIYVYIYMICDIYIYVYIYIYMYIYIYDIWYMMCDMRYMIHGTWYVIYDLYIYVYIYIYITIYLQNNYTYTHSALSVSLFAHLHATCSHMPLWHEVKKRKLKSVHFWSFKSLFILLGCSPAGAVYTYMNIYIYIWICMNMYIYICYYTVSYLSTNAWNTCF